MARMSEWMKKQVARLSTSKIFKPTLYAFYKPIREEALREKEVEKAQKTEKRKKVARKKRC